MPDAVPQPDPTDALLHVVDDEEEIAEARRWAVDQLLAEVAPQVLCDQMVELGWDLSDAESIVEFARKQTRQNRGVVTREDVLRDLNVDYRRATGGMSVAFRSGLFWALWFYNRLHGGPQATTKTETDRAIPQVI